LQSALHGQDVLIIAFAFGAPLNLEERLIDAAEKLTYRRFFQMNDLIMGYMRKGATLLGRTRKYRE
jgi:hypothetical protein